MQFKTWPREEMSRDLSFVEIGQNQMLVIACDSAGAIGPKEGDLLQVPGEIVGRFTVRVALMEVLAVGAKPISIINTLAVEYDPTGKEIIQGIREEAAKLGLGNRVQINGSTEENFPTSQTGIGVTVIGLVEKAQLKMATSQVDDQILAIGLPLVGAAVLQHEALIPEVGELMELVAMDGVHEVIPVGSKGIGYEVEVLARMSGLRCELEPGLEMDLNKSAGPAATVLVSVASEMVDLVREQILKPTMVIGTMVREV